jgi:hypothetical protein
MIVVVKAVGKVSRKVAEENKIRTLNLFFCPPLCVFATLRELPDPKKPLTNSTQFMIHYPTAATTAASDL